MTVTLTPIEIKRNITLLRSWVVNDPTGRWRSVNRNSTIEKCTFEVLSKGCHVIHTFEIPFSTSESRLWVVQCKDQWVITEYIEERSK